MTTYHKHHIIPRHAGGTDDPENIVELTITKHAEAHRLLWEKYGHPYDYTAWRGLAKMISKEDAIKEVQQISGKLSGLASKGRKHSEETKRKIRENSQRPEAIIRSANAGKSHKWSDEEKQAMGISRKNVRVSCLVCKKNIPISTFTLYHKH